MKCINDDIPSNGEVKKDEIGTYSKVHSEMRGRDTVNADCVDNSIICEIETKTDGSKLVFDIKVEVLVQNSCDRLVNNTNNSIGCLYKHFALRCQVSALYTAQNMVASLDTSSLEGSSDRLTANFIALSPMNLTTICIVV